MVSNPIKKSEKKQQPQVPSPVVFYDFASKKNLSQLSRYIAELKTDLLWLHEKLEEELKAEKDKEKELGDFEVGTNE